MSKDVQVTLYDVFGYLLPGGLALAALLILFWAIFCGAYPVVIGHSSFDVWAAFGIVAYVVGHIVQALANLLTDRMRRSEEHVLGSHGIAPHPLIEAVRSGVGKVISVDGDKLPTQWIFRVCDEALVQYGRVVNRDIYVHREGFYRGMSVGFAMLAIAILVRAAIGQTTVSFSAAVYPVSSTMMGFIALVCLIGMWTAWQRFKRFGAYRVNSSVVAFLLLLQTRFSGHERSGAHSKKE